MKEVNYALQKALSRGDKTVAAMRVWLTKKGHEATLIETALMHAQADDLLNDERFAQRFVECCLRKGHGPGMIKEKLRAKGAEFDTITTALTNVSEEQWRSSAHQWAKRQGLWPIQNTEMGFKLYDKLKQRGYKVCESWVSKEYYEDN